MSMKASAEEILQYIEEEDVKFIRLAFCDVYGRQKNISVMPGELKRAFTQGIAINGAEIAGFGGVVHSDLFLHPDPSTIAVLPWRPEHGRVVRMFCSVTHPDGTPLDADCRALLERAVQTAKQQGIVFSFASEMEFYLFQTDEFGNPTERPLDHAGYMDIAPEDRGENVRREICLTLERMGIQPESSHHEAGPGQNEIVFRHADPLCAADQTVTFCSVVRTIAARNGLYADFSPCPLAAQPGNDFHIHLSASSQTGEDVMPFVMAGILHRIAELTAFLNPCEASYIRLCGSKAPTYRIGSSENRSQLLRVPAAFVGVPHVELRSPDPSANPYLAFALLIHASLEGIRDRLVLPAASDCNWYEAAPDVRDAYQKLPVNLAQARQMAVDSSFLQAHLPEPVLRAYCEREESV